MVLVAGVDCSTQSTKVVVCDAATGRVVRERPRAAPGRHRGRPRPSGGTRCGEATADGLLDGVARDRGRRPAARHGHARRVRRGRSGPRCCGTTPARPAPPPTSSPSSAGRQAWADAVGSVPVASFTVTKLRWLAEHEPEAAARVGAVLLPHDWLTTGSRPAAAEPTTDRGDASGTGLLVAGRRARTATTCSQLAFGRDPGAAAGRRARPRRSGRPRAGALVGPGTGDNMAAALGLGARPGDVVVSLGTSGHRVRGHRRRRPPTRPASWPASPTRPAGTCRWSAR